MKQGWEIKKLGEVCNVIAGQSPEGKFYNSEGNGMPFYQGKKEYGEKYIGEPTTWSTKITKEAEAGDILISVRAPVGPVNFATQKICIGRGLAAIRAGKNIDKEFLYNFLIKHENEIEGNVGAVFNSINKTQIESIKIPLPPLPEQQRIVSILDEAFSAIAKAKANAEQNLKNAKELFESYLQGVFENGKEIWEEKTLDEVCEFRNGAAHEQNIDENGKYILVNSKFISADGEKFKRTNNALAPLYVNDIAFVMSDVPNGKALAKCFLVDENDTYTLNQRIGAIKSKVFVPEFLVYQFNRNKYLLSFNNGENQTNLRKGEILKCPLWITSKEEQQTIVRHLDALRAETQKLEALYQKKIDDLEELKKSILQKAFAGELKTEKAVAV
jgi:type I restriction enzyme S subunit